MIGVVLSGGQSTRMGKDKGLMTAHGKAWSRIAFEKMTALEIPAVVSINELQLQEYLGYFDRKELIVDRLDLKIAGPLAGVLNTHLLHSDQDVMVLACDMIDMKPSVLEKLKNDFQEQQPESMAFKGMNIEPLCAVYSARGLKKIKALYDDNLLGNNSMISVLEILKTNYLSIPDEWLQSFKNFNRVVDLE